MTSVLQLLSFNVTIDLDRYPLTIDSDIYNLDVRRETITTFLVSAGVDLDLICLQGFLFDDFKEIVRRLQSFYGFISPETGSAILVRKTSFTSFYFEDRMGVVELTGIPVGSNKPILIRSANRIESIQQLQLCPEIIAGPIESVVIKEHLETHGFIDVLRKVGNYEPTRPFDNGPSITDYIFVKDIKPISGDVADEISSKYSNGNLWSIKSEALRIEAILTTYGSDHLPIRAVVRI